MSDVEGSGGQDAGGAPLPPPPGAPLLPPPPVALETTIVKGGGSRKGLAVGALVAVALVAGGLAFLAQGDDGDADGSLQAAQAVVEGTDSYRFELLTVSREVTGDPDGAGSDTTTRTLTSGDVAADDEWRVVEDMGDEYGEELDEVETARVGDTIYIADPYMTNGDDAPKWIASSAEDAMSAEDIAAMYGSMEDFDEEIDGFDDVYRLELMTAAYLFDLEGQPTALTRLVTDATEPAIEDQLADGGVRLRVQLAPLPELAKVAEDPIPPVDLLLDLNAEDQPVRAAFTAEAGSSSSKIEVTFSDWGADISVTAPAEGDIDHTPWLAEEALAQVDPALLLAPSVLPESMELMSATVYSDDFAFLGEDGASTDDGCESVELSYGSEGEFGFGVDDPTVDMSEEEIEEYYTELAYLSISVSTADCVGEFMTGDFGGELGGRPASGGDGNWEVKVGDAVVMISSLYEDDVLAPLVASIAPVTVEQLAASVPDWAAASDFYGAMYSGAHAFGP